MLRYHHPRRRLPAACIGDLPSRCSVPVARPVRPAVRQCALVVAFAESEVRYRTPPSRTLTRRLQQDRHKAISRIVIARGPILRSTFGDRLYDKGVDLLLSQFSVSVLETEKAQRAVDAVQKALSGTAYLKVPRIHKAGSYGRRTHVPDHFDVDLIAYVTEFKGQKLSYPDDWKDERFMLDLRRELKVDDVDVDLLLVPDCVTGRPGPDDVLLRQHKALMEPVYSDPEGSHYDQLRERADSGALTEFVREQPGVVNVVTRFIKACYKGGLKEGRADEDRIGSVALEVLVLAAYQRLRNTYGSKPPTAELLKATLRLIVKAVLEEGQVVMVDAAKWGYSEEVGLRASHNWENDPVKIIHPSDPTCNLARPRRGRKPDWARFAREAQNMLHVMSEGTFGDLLSHPTVYGALSLAGGVGGSELKSRSWLARSLGLPTDMGFQF